MLIFDEIINIPNKKIKEIIINIKNIKPFTKTLSITEVFLFSISLLKSLYSLITKFPKKIDAKEIIPKIIFNNRLIFYCSC